MQAGERVVQFSEITGIETADDADMQTLVTEARSGSQNHVASTKH